jgi:hypothetical protein
MKYLLKKVLIVVCVCMILVTMFGNISLAEVNDLSFEILSPQYDSKHSELIKIMISKPNTTYSINESTAQIGDRICNLSNSGHIYVEELDRYADVYSGTLNIDGLTRGEKTLTITVNDSIGGSKSIETKIYYAGKPGLIIDEPKNETIYGSVVDLKAEAKDLGGEQCKLIVTLGEQSVNGDVYKVMEFDNSVNQKIDASGFEGGRLLVTFEAINEFGIKYSESRTVYINSFLNIGKIAEVKGTILDYDDHRILYQDENHWLKILDYKNQSVEQSVYQSDEISTAKFTSKGIIFLEKEPSGYQLLELRDNTINLLDLNVSGLKANSNYAAWDNSEEIFLYDIQSGEKKKIGNAPIDYEDSSYTYDYSMGSAVGLSLEGDVVYTIYEAERYKGVLHSGAGYTDYILFYRYSKGATEFLTSYSHNYYWGESVPKIISDGYSYAENKQLNKNKYENKKLNKGFLAFNDENGQVVVAKMIYPSDKDSADKFNNEKQVTFFDKPSELIFVDEKGNVLVRNEYGYFYIKYDGAKGNATKLYSLEYRDIKIEGNKILTYENGGNGFYKLIETEMVKDEIRSINNKLYSVKHGSLYEIKTEIKPV